MFKMMSVLFLFGLLVCKTQTREDSTPSATDDARQLVIVLSPDDESTTATLRRYEKKRKKWHPSGTPHPVNLGRTVLAWGRGLHDPQPGYQKKEGDGKSPAGIFRFGTAFGYAPPGDVSLKMDYLQLTAERVCVEDTASRYYNQIVDETTVTKDWDSNEAMRREDWLYKWGLYVEHNVPAKAGSGSCIFFHLWRAPGSPTLGCTAMAEENLLDLLQWLDPAGKPLLVQMTAENYETFQKAYGWPEVGR
jgi:zinc D-Ala-D-Ala dipeptidase